MKDLAPPVSSLHARLLRKASIRSPSRRISAALLAEMSAEARSRALAREVERGRHDHPALLERVRRFEEMSNSTMLRRHRGVGATATVCALFEEQIAAISEGAAFVALLRKSEGRRQHTQAWPFGLSRRARETHIFRHKQTTARWSRHYWTRAGRK